MTSARSRGGPPSGRGATTATRVATVVALAAAVVFATATAALAHPGFRPAEVPAGGPVDVELVIEHACAAGGGEPAEGEEASPTVLVAMTTTDTFTVLPRPVPGWSITSEGDVVVWEATDGGDVDELVLPAVVEVVGEPGEEIPQPMYQECANGEFFRWVAGPGEDGDPAIDLAVAEGTPPPLATPVPSPPPATAAPSSAPMSPTPTPLGASSNGPTTTPAPPGTGPTPGTAAVTTPTPSATPMARAPASASPTASPSVQATDFDDEGDDDGGMNPAIWVAILVAAFAGVGLASRRRDGTGADDEATP